MFYSGVLQQNGFLSWPKVPKSMCCFVCAAMADVVAAQLNTSNSPRLRRELHKYRNHQCFSANISDMSTYSSVHEGSCHCCAAKVETQKKSNALCSTND